MTLRLITVGLEQVAPEHYQPMYRTLDLQLPPELDFSRKAVIGFELIEDVDTESIHTELPKSSEEGTLTKLDE